MKIKVTIGFVQQSYNVTEGEGGVTLEVEVREGEIPVGNLATVTLDTIDQSANGVVPSNFE